MAILAVIGKNATGPFSFKDSTNAITIGSATDLGSWILGPTNYNGQHEVNGQLSQRVSISDFAGRFINSNAGPIGLLLQYTTASPNGTGNKFIQCIDSTTTRFEVRSNGGIANFSANNVNLSDIRLKNILSLTSPQLDRLCKLDVTNFEYKDAPGHEIIGLIAQQVESVAPDLVGDGGTQTVDGKEIQAKAVKLVDLQHCMLKAIQELKQENDSLRARIEALEAK